MRAFSSRLILTLFMIGLSITSVQAGGAGTVSLRAVTVSGAPLMRPVSWRIYVVRNNRRLFTTSFSRHSGVLSLRQGRYIAELQFNNIRYEQPFVLQAEHDVAVTVTISTETRIY